MRQTGEPPVDLFAHPGRHPQGLRLSRAVRRLRPPRRRRPRPQPRRLAGGHEPLARLFPGLRRSPLRGPRADAHPGHARGARARDPPLRPRGLSRGAWPPSAPPTRRNRPPTRAPGSATAAAAAPGPTRSRSNRPCACPPDGEEAQRIAARARTGQAAIESVEAQTQRMPPPALYDLTELQRHANRLFGFSAQRTLDVAQALYETPQADQLSAYRQPPPVAGCGRHAAAVVPPSPPPTGSSLRRGTGERPLGPPLRRRREGHRPPRDHSYHHARPAGFCSRPTSARSTI